MRTPLVFAAAVCLGVAASACDVKVGEKGLSFDVAEGKATDEWTRTYTLAPKGRLEVINIHGAIEAYPAKGTQVEIVAQRDARASTNEEAQEVLKTRTLDEEVTPTLVRVRNPPPQPGVRRFVRVQFRVGIPEGLDVLLRTENGPVLVENVKSRLTVSTSNNGITIRGLSTAADLQTVNGGVTLVIASMDGDVKINAVNGAIRIEMPSTISADLEAHTVNGGIDIDSAMTFQASQKEPQLVVGRFNNGGPRISAQMVNGGIRISAPANR